MTPAALYETLVEISALAGGFVRERIVYADVFGLAAAGSGTIGQPHDAAAPTPNLEPGAARRV